MSYEFMESKLRTEFKQNHHVWIKFVDLIEKNKYLPKRELESLKFKNSNHKEFFVYDDINLTITYPGYKTELKHGKYLTYDYRVNYNGIAISHPSIIIDLYNKAAQHPNSAKRMKEFLILLAQYGDSLDIIQFSDLSSLNFTPPSNQLLDSCNEVFNMLDKSYLEKSNKAWNFSFHELKTIISWISLQEDINYPMRIGKLQGRMMPFFRYIEAIFAGLNHNQELLKQVIERALVHYQPSLWKTIDYSGIVKLKALYQK